MKIRTINPVTFNNGLTGQETSNVEGIINNTSYINGFQSVIVNYIYQKPDNTILKSDQFTVNGIENLNTQFAIVYPILPPADNEYPYTPTKFYEVFKYHMANTFNTTVNNIEIIN